MPKQESYLELKRGDDSVSVLKTYDIAFAKEAFDSMDQAALNTLALSLRLEENFEPADIPASDAVEYGDFLWDALIDSAREDGNVRSYFVVELRSPARGQRLIYVSGDWPSAEAVAKSLSQTVPVIA
jgi:Ni/Co efflux regulator RcnB